MKKRLVNLLIKNTEIAQEKKLNLFMIKIKVVLQFLSSFYI